MTEQMSSRAGDLARSEHEGTYQTRWYVEIEGPASGTEMAPAIKVRRVAEDDGVYESWLKRVERISEMHTGLLMIQRPIFVETQLEESACDFVEIVAEGTDEFLSELMDDPPAVEARRFEYAMLVATPKWRLL